MRTVGSAMGRVGRGFGVLATGAALTIGLAACAKTVSGTALSGGSAALGSGAPTPTGSAHRTTEPPATDPGALNARAKETCDHLPQDAATSAFGLPDVKVTSAGGTTLDAGVIQIQCVVSSSNQFRANVVVQVYPPAVLSTADQYAQIMRQRFSPVQDLGKIDGAEVAGTFKRVQDGQPVDEGYAANKDTDTGGVDVLIVGVADEPGAEPKMIAFLKALAKS